MSIRIRILIGLSSLAFVCGAQGQQAKTSKSSVRSTPSTEESAPSEVAIDEMIRAGRSIEAARLLEEQSRRTPGNKAVKLRVAKVYELEGDLASAKRAAYEAAAGDTPSPEALAVLGRIAAREGDWSNAVVHWRSVVNAMPNQASAHLDYANALEHVGDATGANNEYAIYRSLSGMPPISKDNAKK